MLEHTSWLEKLHRESAGQVERDADPWVRLLEPVLPPAGMISTVAVCNLIGIKANSGNARKVARCMKTLGFFPIKSRKLLPGGWRTAEGRGWVRPAPGPQVSARAR